MGERGPPLNLQRYLTLRSDRPFRRLGIDCDAEIKSGIGYPIPWQRILCSTPCSIFKDEIGSDAKIKGVIGCPASWQGILRSMLCSISKAAPPWSGWRISRGILPLPAVGGSAPPQFIVNIYMYNNTPKIDVILCASVF